jgi:diaminopimelate epimerase
MRTKLSTPLTKLSATGNDFLVVDLIHHGPSWAETGGQKARPDWVRTWCDRHNGIGADGALFIEPHATLDFTWDFYNSDGSAAEMCGNAARAVSLYVSRQTGKTELKFLTVTGEVQGRIHSPEKIEVSLNPVTQEEWNQQSHNPNRQVTFDFVRAGVPHAVIRVPDVKDLEMLRSLALELKREARFQQEGVNVTFVRARSQDVVESVTFERGVEDFTLSCGTGAVAAAHSFLRSEEGKSLEVQVPGGQLFVIWKNGRPHLIGPARIVAEVDWLAE